IRASRRSGSITHTSRVPPESQSAILASVSPGRSPGDRTSTTRSGPRNSPIVPPLPEGEGVRGDSMLRPYLTLAGERPWQSPVTGHLVWDRDDDIALLVPLLDVAVGCGNLLQRITRSEEHTSELQSPCNLVCRLL